MLGALKTSKLLACCLLLWSAVVSAQVPLLLDDALLQGNTNAEWVLVEFTDLHCPYCARFNRETWPALKQHYIATGQVLFAAVDYPIDQLHPNAKIAALLLRCAAGQTPYDDVKAFLFSRPDLSNTVISELVETFNLPPLQFKTCLSSQAQMDAIARNILMAQRLGVQVTPAFVFGKKQGNEVIEPVLFYGALSEQEFAAKLSGLMQ